VALDPNCPICNQPVACDQVRASTSGGLVGEVMGLLGLVLFLDWCIYILLYFNSHQIPG
jgi:hypothetical protein